MTRSTPAQQFGYREWSGSAFELRLAISYRFAMQGSAKRYEWLLWDWNGTLLNDVGLCHEIVSYIVQTYLQREIELDEYRRHFRHPVDKFYESIGFDLTRVDYTEIAEEFHLRYEAGYPRCLLHPGVEEIIRRVHGAGISQGILSALPQSILKPSVVHFGLDRYMRDVVSPLGNEAYGKLDEARALAADRNLDPAQVLLVGDTDHDAEVARVMGFACVLVATGYQDRSRLSTQGYPVIESLAELEPHVGW